MDAGDLRATKVVQEHAPGIFLRARGSIALGQAGMRLQRGATGAAERVAGLWHSSRKHARCQIRAYAFRLGCPCLGKRTPGVSLHRWLPSRGSACIPAGLNWSKEVEVIEREPGVSQPKGREPGMLGWGEPWSKEWFCLRLRLICGITPRVAWRRRCSVI